MLYRSNTVTHIFGVDYWRNIEIENCAIRRLWYVLSRVSTLTRDTDIADLSVRPFVRPSVRP